LRRAEQGCSRDAQLVRKEVPQPRPQQSRAAGTGAAARGHCRVAEHWASRGGGGSQKLCLGSSRWVGVVREKEIISAVVGFVKQNHD